VPGLIRELRRRNLCAMEVAFSATQALAIIPGAVLPKGSRVIGIQSLGGATGGASPTVDIGTIADGVAIMNEQDADTPGAMIVANGALFNVVNSAPVQLAGRVGASAAGGGTHRSVIYYTLGPIPLGT
jgi:hypothetical protein